MSDSLKTVNVVTTELARINQLAASVATKFLEMKETTINSKRGILPSAGVTTFPRIRYFGIGINGCSAVSSDLSTIKPWYPSPANMDLYEPIPFRVVESPLSKAEASKYRMVTKENYGGVDYYCYWLKLLEFESESPRLTTVNGTTQTSYALDISNLHPTPLEMNSVDVSNSDGTRTEIALTAIRRITNAEVKEAINVIYKGNLLKARISEFGLYSGIEVQNVSGDGLGIPYSYTEAAYVQLASHMCCMGYDLSADNALLEERVTLMNGALVRV